MRRTLLLLVALLPACDGCSKPRRDTTTPAASGSTSPAPEAASGPVRPIPRVFPPLDAKDVTQAPVFFPPQASPEQKVPFVLYLHGLGGNGESLLAALRAPSASVARGFAYAAPDGEVSSKKQRFWNATAACCDFDKKGTPHVELLGKLIDKAKADPRIDPARIWVVGFSNGAFMAHRLACELPQVTGIVSLAGAVPGKDEACKRKTPVAMLHVHGDDDRMVPYTGGRGPDSSATVDKPSALDTALFWASRNGCARHEKRADETVGGKEAVRSTWEHCQAPTLLLTLKGGSHFAPMGADVQTIALDFLFRK